jgi:hypothetical protein
MKINEKSINPGPNSFYERAFLSILESHMDYLRKHPQTATIPVSEQDAVIYNGDLQGYLTKYNISMKIHWTIMRMSNLYSTFEFGPDVKFLLVPDETVVDKIRQIYVSKTGTVGL